MAVADVNGRRYARLDDQKPGDVLIADGGFDCMREGVSLVVAADNKGELFVPCDEGQHGLDGQDDGDGFLVGLYPA